VKAFPPHPAAKRRRPLLRKARGEVKNGRPFRGFGRRRRGGAS
jgi:hypothetical protein